MEVKVEGKKAKTLSIYRGRALVAIIFIFHESVKNTFRSIYKWANTFLYIYLLDKFKTIILYFGYLAKSNN